MSRIAAIRAANASQSLSYLPVAVFIGGTSGIGQGFAEAFARHTRGNAHIILVGRNRTAAESIISGFPKPSLSQAKHEFLSCDATLMRNVQRATNHLLSVTPKINFLVMSPGFSSLDWDETEEGIDKKMALHYYARWKFINNLLPALSKAREEGEDAKVLTTMTTKRKGVLDLEDLGLKKARPHNTSAVVSIYNDLMVDELALRHSSLTFIHAYPGAVRTSIGASSPSPTVRVVSMLISGPLRPIMASKEDAGEYLLHGMLHTTSKPGGWRLSQYGEDDLGKHAYSDDEEAHKLLWRHTEDTMKVLEEQDA